MFLSVSRFEDLIDAVKETCGLVRGTYNVASLALKYGFSLKTCCMIIHGDAGKTKNKELLESMNSFKSLMENEYSKRVSIIARIQLRKGR